MRTQKTGRQASPTLGGKQCMHLHRPVQHTGRFGGARLGTRAAAGHGSDGSLRWKPSLPPSASSALTDDIYDCSYRPQGHSAPLFRDWRRGRRL